MSWPESFLRKIIKSLFYLYIITLPVMCVPRHFPLGGKIQYSDVVFLAMLAFWTIYALVFRKKVLPSVPVLVSLGILWLVNTVSCAISKDPSSSLMDLLGLFYLGSLLVVVSSLLSERRMFEKSALVLFCVSVAVSLWGLISFAAFTVYKANWAMNFLFYLPYKASIIPLPRISSTMVLPEMLITFSQLGIVMGTALLELRAKAAEKICIISGIIVILMAACFAYSRSLAGFFLAISAVLLLRKTGRWMIPIKIITAIIAVFLFLSAILTSIWTVYPVTVSADRSAHTLKVSVSTLPDIRAFLGSAAIKIASEHPLFGIGQGSFTKEARHYVDPEAIKDTLRFNGLDALLLDPHSMYLGALAETGYLGLAAIIALLFFIIRAAYVSIRNSPESPYRNICIYLLCGFAGYIITGLFVDIFSMRQLWLSWAFMLGASSIARSYDKQT